MKLRRHRGGVEGLGCVWGTSYTSNRNLEPGMEEAFKKATLDNARNSVQETPPSQTPTLNPQTPNPNTQTPRPKPQTPIPNPKPRTTLNPEPQSLHPKP